MENEASYPPEFKNFLAAFTALSSKDKNLNHGNDKVMSSALWYEKFRRALEYQEDHLIFKNAVTRIARRYYALSFSIGTEALFDGLMSELAWADYVNLDGLTDEEVAKIKSILERYLFLIRHAKTKSLDSELQKTIFSWMASEIDELLFCRKRQELLIDFAYHCLKDNIKFISGHINHKEVEIQLKLAIFSLVYKPDYSYAQFWLIKKIFPEFENFNQEKAREIGLHYDNILLQIEKVFKNPHAKDYMSYAKRHIAPFILISNLPHYQKNLTSLEHDPEKLKNWLMDIYDNLLFQTKEKVWRGTIRALIFIFFTKISLAFLIEMPFDQLLKGSISYIPLVINICLPPVLMFFAGISMKVPPPKNRLIVTKAISNLLIYEKIDEKPFYVGFRKRSVLDIIFNILYFIFNLAIVFGVIVLLRKIDFNFVSIALFFFFVSAVSFFSFRIRNIALELLMQTNRDNFFVSIIEFVFLPFILIGKYLSAVITKSNPFTITLDFLIEAPLKTILKIANSWMRFIRQKKDDLDL